MRIYTLLLFCSIISITNVSQGQDVFDQIKKYNKANQLDSTFALIDHYEIHFKDAEQWDSLVHLLNQKSSVYTRAKSMEEIDAVLASTQKYATKHLEKQHPYYLEYLHQRSRHNTNAGRLTEAMNGFDSIITLTKKYPDSLHFREQALVSKAFLQLSMYEIQPSINTALEALDKLIEIQDTFSLIQAYQVLAIGNNFFHNTKESLKYNLLNVDLAKGKFGKNHPNVGITYDQIGSTYREIGQPNEALYYYQLAKDILYDHYKSTGVGRYFSATIFNLGILYNDLGENNLAFENINLCYQIESEELGVDNYNNFYNYNAMTEIFLQ
ncbi:MAG: tetratricopeptide repeat protein, partial [Saprospiraceae bacterium]|nr:tetratricopeptide repeat protein [Saprospiraceae bacterium]